MSYFLQSMILMAGSSGVMIGNYLTTKGREVEDDLQMLKTLQLEIRDGTQKKRAATENTPPLTTATTTA